jgi:hypothetical protein
MAEVEAQDKLYAELAGRALLDPEFRKAVLQYPDSVLGEAGLSKKYRAALVKALQTPNIDAVKVADLPDLFGGSRGGTIGGSILEA